MRYKPFILLDDDERSLGWMEVNYLRELMKGELEMDRLEIDVRPTNGRTLPAKDGTLVEDENGNKFEVRQGRLVPKPKVGMVSDYPVVAADPRQIVAEALVPT